MAAEQAAQGKVEASVFAIITAFTSGLDVFRKLRDRRGRRKKSRKSHCSRSHSTAVQEPSDDESKLGKSLQRGSVEIQDRYQINRRHAGESFARGDAIAHASLTEVLLKLNTGLVAIISSFLCHGKSESNLDYKSLAHLSDCSRYEAIEALDQLYQRLSQSQAKLDSRRPCCPNCRSQKHADCGSVIDLQSTREQKPAAKNASLVAVKQPPPPLLPPTKTPKPKGSQSRLVMVRSRKSRLKPSSSTPVMQPGKPATTTNTFPRPLSPEAPTTIPAAASRAPPPPPPPPPKLRKRRSKNGMPRSMTSLAAEPIPEHSLPASPPLPASLLSPPPFSPYHALHRADSAVAGLRRTRSSVDSTTYSPANNGAPPRPPKIPLTSQKAQRTAEPASSLLAYSPYPAMPPVSLPDAQQPTPVRNHRLDLHPRLRPPQRHSSMPPIPLLSSTTVQPQTKPQSPPPAQPPPRHPASDDETACLATNDAKLQPQPQQQHHPQPRRRTTVPVPASVCSFASDSTKLGEIPMARWADGPWDAERATRLNAEAGWGAVVAGSGGARSELGEGGKGAAESGGGGGGGADGKKKKGGRGRFGALWRWGSASSGSGSEREKMKGKERGGRGVKV